MSDLNDFELLKPARDEDSQPITVIPDSRPPRTARWLAGAAVVVVLGSGGYLVFRRSVIHESRIEAEAPLEIPASEAPSPSPLELRPLNESDAVVRELAKGLSHHHRFAVWLGANDLMRRLVATIVGAAAGESPRAPLDFLAPKGSFTVLQTPERTVIDRRSYARYDSLVEVVMSLDSQACARVYRQLEPFFDAAYGELGRPNDRFAVTLERALRLLLETPVPDGDIAVRHALRAPLLYEYADPNLETLTPAQKHLLRLGPENARRVKAKLRELAREVDLNPP